MRENETQVCNFEYLDKIGYRDGKIMQATMIHVSNAFFDVEHMKKKRVVLFGAGENAVFAEMLLKEKGIDIFAYADNSEKLQGTLLRGKRIGSPYDFFNNEEYYFVITVSDGRIDQVRLQLMINKVYCYSIFLNRYFHDFMDEDKDLQKALWDSVNSICFKKEYVDKVLSYIGGFIKLDFLLWSSLWSHWAYLWEKEEIKKNQYQEIMEIGPGYGLMSMTLLEQFRDIQITWLLLEDASSSKVEGAAEFYPDLRKVKEKYPDQISERYLSVERDDLSSLPEYDLIILTEVFEHFALNPVPTMKKIGERLREHGKIILTTPNWGHLHYYRTWEEMPCGEDISNAEYRELLKCGHCYQYTKEELFTIFERAGLCIEKYELSDSNNHNFLLKKRQEKGIGGKP